MSERLEQIKLRNLSTLQGTKFYDDFQWLIQQIELQKKDIEGYRSNWFKSSNEVIRLKEENNELDRDYNRVITELINLNLWSARRLPTTWKDYAHNELEKITGEKHEK